MGKKIPRLGGEEEQGEQGEKRSRGGRGGRGSRGRNFYSLFPIAHS